VVGRALCPPLSLHDNSEADSVTHQPTAPHPRPVDRAHRPGAPPVERIAFPAIRATPLPLTGLGAGEVIASPWRSWFEERFQTDFSAVRLHRGAVAGQWVESYDARAFTYGSHIVLGADAPSLDSVAGRLLLAHELAHTLQQAGSIEHRTSLAPVRVQSFSASPGVQCWELPRLPTWQETKSAARHVAHAVVAAPGQVFDAVVETGSQVVHYGLDQLMAFLEERFPTFVKLLRSDPVEFLKQKFTDALDSVLGGLVGRIRREGLVETLQSVFGGAVEGVQQMIGDLARGDCTSLFAAIRGLIDFADVLFGPELRAIRDFASSVGDTLGDLWHRFGAPAVDAIGDFAGEVWDTIRQTASDFWAATADVRQFFSDVWESFKRAFGIVWDSGAGVVDWLIEKATAAWNAIKEALGPALIPFEILAALALQFTPFGPILNVYLAYKASTGAISWIYDHWEDIQNAFIEARQYLHDSVLPQIMSGVHKISAALDAAATWVADILGSIAQTVSNLLTAIGLGPVLSAFSSFVSWLSEKMQALAQWASGAFTSLVTNVRSALQAIYEHTRPIWGLLAAIILFPEFPFLLPVVLAGWAWRLTPDCLKEPVIDWVIGIMIGAVRALPEFSNFGEAWPHAKAQILSTLGTIQGLPMAQKVAATNRVAKMMTLEDVEWIGNLVQAAIQMPDYFVGQFEEELIGMNLTEPLPFEPRPGATPSAPTTLLHGLTAGGANPDLNVLLRSTLSASDVAVDQVAPLDLSSEFMRSLPDGETMFGQRSDDYASIDRVRREMMAAPTGDSATAPAAPAAAGPVMPDTTGMTPAQATEARLQAMIDQPMPDECPGRQAPPVAGPETIPPELQIGPLSQAQRGRYMLAQMGKGLRKWWQCNRSWLLPTIFVVVCALIAAEILTEGAVTAALPPLMEIVTALFIGIAVVRSAYYMAEYVALAAPGNITGGARSLAHSFAVAAVELIFALLFNLNDVVKSLKGGLKAALRDATEAAKNFGRTTVEAVGKLGRVTVKGLTAAGRNIRRIPGIILREGRLIFEGVGEGLGRGVRSLRELGERLWQRCRFRGFSLERHGRHFQLWGHFNPKVLLADGTILEDVGDDAIRSQLGIAKGGATVGREVRFAGQRGVVVAAGDVDSVLSSMLRNPSLRDSRFGQELVDRLLSSGRSGRDAINDIAIQMLRERSGTMVRDIATAFASHGVPPNTLDDILRRCFDIGHTPPDSMLRRLSQICRSNPSGLEYLISDLRHVGEGKFLGAEWILRYLTDQGPITISSIRAFEETVLNGARRYDVVINNVRYEFKNIPNFVSNSSAIDTFLRQVANDQQFFGANMATNLRWVYAPRAGSRDAMIQAMEQALRNAGAAGTHGLNPTTAQQIIDALPSIIRVGS
jgi:hypothetical protein